METKEIYEILKSFIFNSDGNIDSNKNTLIYLEKHYNSIYKYFKTNFPEITSVSEFLWLYENNFKRPFCKVCNKPTSFISYKQGYRNLFCGNECRITKQGMQYWREHGKETCVKKYGSAYPFQSKTIQDKVNKNTLLKYGTIRPKDAEWATKIKNKTINSSKIQNKVKKYLLEKYPDTKEEYKDARYPYRCDFYIPSLDLFIEIQGHWTHNSHGFDKLNAQDNEILESWKSKSLSSQFYENAIDTWTFRDVEKRNTAKANNLNFFEFFGNSLEDFVKKFNDYLDHEQNFK